MKKATRSNQGSALMFALIAMLVLTMVGIEVARLVTTKYMNTFHAASWQESLLAAESGADLGIVELRKNLATPSSGFQSPWTSGTGSSGWNEYDLTTMNYAAGEGGTQMTIQVAVDAPPGLVDGNGWQYYRIRATGTNSIPGPARVGDEKRDLDLRKLSLQTDRLTGQPLARPQVSRRIEVIARPMSPFTAAVVARGNISFTDAGIVVDSYDSRDPNKSTNGQWDVSKRQQHGDVATDGTLISAGGAQIYGSVSTNNGTATGVANVTGEIRNDFYQDLISVNPPTWTTGIAQNPNQITDTTTITSSTTKGGARYKLSSIKIDGNKVLTIAGDPSGATSYVDIWVTGDFTVNGNGMVYLDKNVIATFYVAGNTSVSGNGIINGNGDTDDRPGHVVFYEIKPPAGTSQSIQLAGNANIEAAVYAPDATVTINGGGSSGTFSGSVVGNTVTMTGITNVHYDEALGNSGTIMDYKIASWFEDTR
jgi:hypothetical protein